MKQILKSTNRTLEGCLWDLERNRRSQRPLISETVAARLIYSGSLRRYATSALDLTSRVSSIRAGDFTTSSDGVKSPPHLVLALRKVVTARAMSRVAESIGD